MLHLWGKNVLKFRWVSPEGRGMQGGRTWWHARSHGRPTQISKRNLHSAVFEKEKVSDHWEKNKKMLKAVFTSKCTSALWCLTSKCPWGKHPFAVVVCRFISVSLPVEGRSLLFVNILRPQFLARHLAIWIALNRTGFTFLFTPLLLFLSLFCLSLSFTPSLLSSFLPLSPSAFEAFEGQVHVWLCWFWLLALTLHATLLDVCISFPTFLAAQAPMYICILRGICRGFQMFLIFRNVNSFTYLINID